MFSYFLPAFAPLRNYLFSSSWQRIFRWQATIYRHIYQPLPHLMFSNKYSPTQTTYTIWTTSLVTFLPWHIVRINLGTISSLPHHRSSIVFVRYERAAGLPSLTPSSLPSNSHADYRASTTNLVYFRAKSCFHTSYQKRAPHGVDKAYILMWTPD